MYLLHGGGGGFRDWSNDSDVARFAESGLLLAPRRPPIPITQMPVKPLEVPNEDYIVHDLIADVESRFSVATGRECAS